MPLFIDHEFPYDLYDGAPFRSTFWGDADGNMCPPRTDSFATEERLRSAQQRRGYDFHEEWVANREQRIFKFKQQLRRNMVYRRTWRISEVGDPRLITAIYKAFGIAKGQDDLNKMCDCLNELGNHNHYLANVLYSRHCDFNEILRCGDCGEYVLSGDASHGVEIDTICGNCLDKYVYSEREDGFVHQDMARAVYASYSHWEQSVPDFYASHGYCLNHFYSYDGNYFVFSSDRDEARRNSEGYDDEAEEEEDSDPGLLSGYHCSSQRRFVESNSGKWPALGLELEVYCEDRYDCVTHMREKFGTKFFLERDGSLDNEYGFEIISHPLGRSEWAEAQSELLNTLRDYDVVGYNEPAGSSYGIHLTTHRRHFSPLAEARISMFLSACENGNFIRALAQRNQIYSAEVGIDSVLKPRISNVSYGLNSDYTRPRNEKRKNRPKKIQGRGKYCAVNWKDNLAEFRIFQSTTNPSSFAKNLELIWALWKWTLPESCTGSSYLHTDFLRWLNLPQNRKDFPNLTAYLSKKVFYGTNFVPFISTWQHLMVKPDSSHAVEPVAA